MIGSMYWFVSPLRGRTVFICHARHLVRHRHHCAHYLPHEFRNLRSLNQRDGFPHGKKNGWWNG